MRASRRTTRILRSAAYSMAALMCLAGCDRLKQRDAGADSPVRRPPPAAIDSMTGRAPAGVRIKVEVLNASRNRGLARKVTVYLRSKGYDVVAIGTTRTTQAATVVLDRSNHPEWAQLIAEAIGGRAESRPDTSRYLDATVLIGSSWTPPPMPFYP